MQEVGSFPILSLDPVRGGVAYKKGRDGLTTNLIRVPRVNLWVQFVVGRGGLDTAMPNAAWRRHAVVLDMVVIRV